MFVSLVFYGGLPFEATKTVDRFFIICEAWVRREKGYQKSAAYLQPHSEAEVTGSSIKCASNLETKVKISAHCQNFTSVPHLLLIIEAQINLMGVLCKIVNNSTHESETYFD